MIDAHAARGEMLVEAGIPACPIAGWNACFHQEKRQHIAKFYFLALAVGTSYPDARHTNASASLRARWSLAPPLPCYPECSQRSFPMSTPTAPPPAPSPVRQEWLDRRHEEILAPDLPIVDPHHHLWDRPGWRYLLDDLLLDVSSGHNILATVFVQARAMYRETGPVEMRPVGETEFVTGVAAMSASGIYGKTKV